MREIRVDLGAIVRNYKALEQQTGAKVCAVLKANAYGHGMHEVAAALDEIVHAFGVADLNEALELRASGIKSRILCWILMPDDDFELALESDIELGVSTFQVLDQLPRGAKIHLKLDTGLGRNGFAPGDWPELFKKLQGQTVAGAFSHLSNTSVEEDLEQQELFEKALGLAKKHDVAILERHLSATAGALSYPGMKYDMVRCGIGLYGLSPYEDQETPFLEPAMQVVARVANLKSVEAGQGVSYGYRYRTDRRTKLALVPFGYAEGLPRTAVGAQVQIGQKRFEIAGRIAMDQFVVDVGDSDVKIGDEVVIFGPQGPSAIELARAAGTINYEIVTRIGGRAIRSYRA